jgi:hypothetical protein
LKRRALTRERKMPIFVIDKIVIRDINIVTTHKELANHIFHWEAAQRCTASLLFFMPQKGRNQPQANNS